MTNEEQQNKILFEINGKLGYLKGKVDGIEKHNTEQNGAIKDLTDASKRHDIALGKIGLIFGFVIVVFNAVVYKAIDLFWRK